VETSFSRLVVLTSNTSWLAAVAPVAELPQLSAPVAAVAADT
jgi:hypothetical protein